MERFKKGSHPRVKDFSGGLDDYQATHPGKLIVISRIKDRVVCESDTGKSKTFEVKAGSSYEWATCAPCFMIFPS